MLKFDNITSRTKKNIGEIGKSVPFSEKKKKNHRKHSASVTEIIYNVYILKTSPKKKWQYTRPLLRSLRLVVRSAKLIFRPVTSSQWFPLMSAKGQVMVLNLAPG